MVEGAVSVVAEVLVPLWLGGLELAAIVLLASVRPWRYVLSPSFRAQTDAAMAGRSRLRKGWHLAWGSLAIAASIAVVAAGVAVFSSSSLIFQKESKAEGIVHKAEELRSRRGHRASEASP